MKTFSFIVPVILCILCLLYLLFYPQQNKTMEHDFSAKVLAKEKEHNTISNALYLATGSAHKEKLEAYEKFYYYTSNQNNITFSINSNDIQYIKTDLLSDAGKHISYHTQKKNNTLLLTLSSEKTDTERIFLSLYNQSVSECTVQIQITTTITTTPKPVAPKPSKPNASTPKPITQKTSKPNASTSKPATKKQNKSTASNPKSVTKKPNESTISKSKPIIQKPNETTISNPKPIAPKNEQSTTSNSKSVTKKTDKTLTTNYKEAILEPQFLLLQPGSSQKITILNYSQKNAKKRFTWLSTNPNIVTVKNGIIETHHDGTAIIYLKDRKHAKNTSSCLIRVIGKEESN